MRDILGAQAVSEMIDDLPEAICTAIGTGLFVTCVFFLLMGLS